MNITAKAEYACIAVLELAYRHETGKPVRIRDIASAHGVPSRFLVQILLQLKGAGLVQSTRGAAGGYQLTKPPEQISLADVLAVVGSPCSAPTASSEKPSALAHVLFEAWEEVRQVEERLLAKTTFAELASRIELPADDMYYI